MTTTINNEWITLNTLRNGIQVQRKFAGLTTDINLANEVMFCKVKYWERELYPNGEVIRTDLKEYSLEDLNEYVQPATETDNGWKMEARAVLTGFINTLGYPGIINPARATLTDVNVLPVNFVSGTALHKETREHITL